MPTPPEIYPPLTLDQADRTTPLAGLALIALFAANLIPSAAHWFEASMIRHMLVQLPLLAIAGASLLLTSEPLQQMLQKIDPGGICALILGTGCMLFWMLPLHLDLATTDPWFRLLKVTTVPLGIGLCWLWAFQRSSLLMKILICFEGWASISRLAWIYLESPQQLCSSYLISEQQQAGTILLVVSVAIAVTASLWGLFGRFDTARVNQPQSRQSDAPDQKSE